MPNELGLLYKQEAVNKRALLEGLHSDMIVMFADLIKDIQLSTDKQYSSAFDLVVHDDVYKYYNNDMQYTVVQQKNNPKIATQLASQGVPQSEWGSYTYIVSITWA